MRAGAAVSLRTERTGASLVRARAREKEKERESEKRAPYSRQGGHASQATADNCKR